MRPAPWAWALVGGVALCACGEEGPRPAREPPTAHHQQPVVGGVASDASTNSVVLLRARGPEGTRSCTASVVAPRMVVTARHCVSPFVDGDFTCTIDGNLGQSSAGAGTVGLPYSPELLEFRVGLNPYTDEPSAVGEKVYVVATDTICRNDLALVLVDRDLDVPVLPMRLTTATLPGEEVMVIGYGQKDVPDAGRFERADVPILSVGPSTLYPEGSNAYPRTFSVGPAVCPGDSGGPSLGDGKVVLGVFSLIRGNCMSTSVRNFYTQLAPYRSFIEDSFADAGFEPIYETPPVSTSGGEAGAAGQNSGGAGGSPATSTETDGAGGTQASGGAQASGGTSQGGSSATSSGGSAAAGSEAASNAGGSSGSGLIGGRRRSDDGCNCTMVRHAPGWSAGLTLWLLGLGSAWRRRARLRKSQHCAKDHARACRY